MSCDFDFNFRIGRNARAVPLRDENGIFMHDVGSKKDSHFSG
jgi:hypothetical protein